ncbi:hypothetical protein CRENBAI_009803 [Crenichthys baileyi]|uniref:Olfactomedin-like domain-containing protein n=1 Tax=Crenichthys baileyi TaxID=28760 RepID=A0AAV9QV76_9TELE
MKTVKEKLRFLKNSVESCKSIHKHFRGQHKHCLKGLITNISDPVITKINPYDKSYISGSWGKQAQMDSEWDKETYWVQVLVSSHIYGNTFRLYQTYKDFMHSANHREAMFASSTTVSTSIEGPSAVLYGEGLYYHCYRSADICHYDLQTNDVKRALVWASTTSFRIVTMIAVRIVMWTLRLMRLMADGLWALYATVGNHGNMVVSKLFWDNSSMTINVSQTWETRLFKKAASNAFMVCGVLYATRYVDDYKEEVFYAFDTATGKEDNSLSLPLEKVAKGVASLSYNPINREIYMYNDGYLLAYQAYF